MHAFRFSSPGTDIARGGPSPCPRRSVVKHMPGVGRHDRRKCTGNRFTARSNTPLTEQGESEVQFLEGFSHQVDLNCGSLTIRPISTTDVKAAAVVLTRGFAGTPEEVSFKDAELHYRLMISKPGDAVLLAARVRPKDRSLLPPNQESRLIGTVSLSLAPSSRETFKTLQPPAESAYLYNMSVDPKFRRQGVARALLSACEQVTMSKGINEVTLHVRQVDVAARKLYCSCGYIEKEKDGPFANLKGIRPRILMRKEMHK